MKDRIPTPGLEGRLLITPEDGSPAFYAKAAMADNPTEQGTPFATATMLTDEVAAMFGMGGEAVPNDIFSILSVRAKITTGTYAGTGKYGADNPNQLTIGENAKMVIVMGASADRQISFAFNGTWIVGGNWMHVETTSGNTSGSNFCKATYQDGVLSWYDADHVGDQLNISGVTYAYVVVSYG